MDTESAFLGRYLGREVEVHYAGTGGSYRDQGRLVGCGDGWVELDKGGPESFLIPMTAIRLMKVLALPGEPGSRLLRPVDGEPYGASEQGQGLDRQR